MKKTLFSVVAAIVVVSCSNRVPKPQSPRDPAASDWQKKAGESLVLIGLVPGAYLGKAKGSYTLARIEIEKGVIVGLAPQNGAVQAGNGKAPVIELKRDDGYDVVYPALINLHNHTKQNNIGLWAEAKGQFQNRFEWRGWGKYNEAVSFNLNPWIGFGPPTRCAAFRWSELSALALGTAYLQGDSSCTDNFALHRVEDPKAYRVERGTGALAGVRAPTDLVYPNEMTIVWEYIRPKMLEKTGTKTVSEAVAKGATYAEAFREVLHEFCPSFKSKIRDVFAETDLKILNDKPTVEAACTALPAAMDKSARGKFIRYVERIHADEVVAPLYNYLKGKRGEPSAVISHLGEGSRTDPYNRREFEVLQALGLDLPRVNLIHGVGIDAAGFKRMGQQNMGLIWSPWSNLLLYGETTDILSAKRAGVGIALGSDWQATGSKGVLEELKIARRYVRNVAKFDDLSPRALKLSAAELGAAYKKEFTDEELYRMVTENPARLIGHFESNAKDGRHGIGTIAPDAIGSLLVVSKRDDDPYTNLVLATEADVNLVVVDGVPQYGNESYLAEYLDGIGLKLADVGGERLSEHLSGLDALKASQFPRPPNFGAGDEEDSGDAPAAPVDKAALERHMVALARSKALERVASSDECRFAEPKLLLSQDSREKSVAEFERASGLNLDRYSDIQKWVGVNILTQSLNVHGQKGGKPESAVTRIVPLLSCNDASYRERFEGFITENGDGELAKNRALRTRVRELQQHDKTKQGFAEIFAQ